MKGRSLTFLVAAIALIGASPHSYRLAAQTSAKDNSVLVNTVKSNLANAVQYLQNARLDNSIPDDKKVILKEAQESAQKALNDLAHLGLPNPPPAESTSDPVSAAQYSLANALQEITSAEQQKVLPPPEKKPFAKAGISTQKSLNFLTSYAAPPGPKLTVQGGSVDFELDAAVDDFTNVTDHLVKITFKNKVAKIRVYIPPASTGGQMFEHDESVTNNWAVTLAFRDVNGILDPNSTMMLCSSLSCVADGNPVASNDVYLKDDNGGHGKFTKTAVRKLRYDRLSSNYCSGVSRCNHIAQVTVTTSPTAPPYSKPCPTSGSNDGACYVWLSYQDN